MAKRNEEELLTNEFIGPKVAPHNEDIGMAWNLCDGGCSPEIMRSTFTYLRRMK